MKIHYTLDKISALETQSSFFSNWKTLYGESEFSLEETLLRNKAIYGYSGNTDTFTIDYLQVNHKKIISVSFGINKNSVSLDFLPRKDLVLISGYYKSKQFHANDKSLSTLFINCIEKEYVTETNLKSQKKDFQSSLFKKERFLENFIPALGRFLEDLEKKYQNYTDTFSDFFYLQKKENDKNTPNTEEKNHVPVLYYKDISLQKNISTNQFFIKKPIYFYTKKEILLYDFTEPHKGKRRFEDPSFFQYFIKENEILFSVPVCYKLEYFEIPENYKKTSFFMQLLKNNQSHSQGILNFKNSISEIYQKVDHETEDLILKKVKTFLSYTKCCFSSTNHSFEKIKISEKTIECLGGPPPSLSTLIIEKTLQKIASTLFSETPITAILYNRNITIPEKKTHHEKIKDKKDTKDIQTVWENTYKETKQDYTLLLGTGEKSLDDFLEKD